MIISFKNTVKTISYGLRITRPLLPCCVAHNHRSRNSNPVRNRVLQTCSNIFFTLEISEIYCHLWIAASLKSFPAVKISEQTQVFRFRKVIFFSAKIFLISIFDCLPILISCRQFREYQRPFRKLRRISGLVACIFETRPQ